MRNRTALVLLQLAACWLQLVHGIGHTTPSGPINVLVNSTIDIACTIDSNRTDGPNSSSLFWFNEYAPVDERNVRIIDAASVQLLIRNAQPSRHVYICKLRQPDGSYQGVGYNEVAVGYKPSHVTNFQCRSYNWINMTCSFQKFDNPVHSIYTLYVRVNPFDDTQFECDLKPLFNGTMTCTMLTDSIDRQESPFYYFTLEAKSPLGSFSEDIELNHFNSIIPGPPEELNVTNIPPNGVTLTWRAPELMQAFPEELIYSISYRPLIDDGDWHEMPTLINALHTEQIRYNINDFPYAAKIYDVRVRVRVLNATDQPDMWSRYETLRFASARPCRTRAVLFVVIAILILLGLLATIRFRIIANDC